LARAAGWRVAPRSSFGNDATREIRPTCFEVEMQQKQHEPSVRQRLHEDEDIAAFMRSRRHLIVLTLFIKGMVISLPTPGILLSHSTTWSVIWWTVFVLWSQLQILYGDASSVGLFLAIGVFVLQLKVLPAGPAWSWACAALEVIFVVVAYRAQREQLLK
jgi:hypothetical protein